MPNQRFSSESTSTLISHAYFFEIDMTLGQWKLQRTCLADDVLPSAISNVCMKVCFLQSVCAFYHYRQVFSSSYGCMAVKHRSVITNVTLSMIIVLRSLQIIWETKKRKEFGTLTTESKGWGGARSQSAWPWRIEPSVNIDPCKLTVCTRQFWEHWSKLNNWMQIISTVATKRKQRR